MAEERRFGVGYALAPKKQQSFIQGSLIELAPSRGIDLVRINTERELADQGPFDCVLHKLYGQDWRRQLEAFRVKNPNAVIVDSPEAIERLHNRISMLQVSDCREMEANYGSVRVNSVPLTRAVEALAALLLSALLRTLDPLAFLPNGAGIKEDPHTPCQAKPADTEGDDEDEDDDGGLEEGEEDPSSEEGEENGNKSNNNKSNSKKAPEDEAGRGAEENGEEEDGNEEDGDDQEDDNEDDNDEDGDDDDDDDDNNDGGEEDEEGVEEENEEEEDEDEEALQPPKKRKK